MCVVQEKEYIYEGYNPRIGVGINKGIRNPGLSSYQKSNYDNQTEHRIPKRLLCYLKRENALYVNPTSS